MKKDFVKIAYDLAKEAHKGQQRKGGGDYFESHCVKVAEYAKVIARSMSMFDNIDIEIIEIVALLHDVVEDTDINLGDINKAFERHRYGHTIRNSIDILSRKSDQNYFDFILETKIDRHARIVKMADLQYNMSDLKEGTLKDKYRLALHVLKN